MRCSKAQRMLSAYLDGELNENDRQELKSHLNICENCRKEKEELVSILTVIVPPKEVEPSPYLFLKTKHKIEERDTKFFLFFPSLQWLKPAVVGLSIIIILALSSVTGTYLGGKISAAKAQREMRLSQEFKTILELGAFDDTPEKSFSSIYNNLLGGESQ